jgi:hypothetical protein
MILPDKALKLLKLALSTTHQGERENASIMFVRELICCDIRAEAFEGPVVPKGFVRTKRDFAAPAPSAAHSATVTPKTPYSATTRAKHNPYGAYEEEQLQWVYENRHRLSKKMAAAVVEEMEARGLI